MIRLVRHNQQGKISENFYLTTNRTGNKTLHWHGKRNWIMNGGNNESKYVYL